MTNPNPPRPKTRGFLRQKKVGTALRCAVRKVHVGGGGSSETILASYNDELTYPNSFPSSLMSGWCVVPRNRQIDRRNRFFALAVCTTCIKDGSSLRRRRSTQAESIVVGTTKKHRSRADGKPEA